MIVACSPAEQPGWLELRQALWPNESASAHLAEMDAFCRSPSRYAQFVAISAVGQPQGFIELALRTDYVNGTESSPVAFLDGIYVAPAHRRQGIARALVAQAERWALSQGCREFASDALLENTHSHSMHRALGFEETERVVYFRKRLVSP
jgi:aminoglycoside 6'-N-acetyltransferase I